MHLFKERHWFIYWLVSECVSSMHLIEELHWFTYWLVSEYVASTHLIKERHWFTFIENPSGLKIWLFFFLRGYALRETFATSVANSFNRVVPTSTHPVKGDFHCMSWSCLEKDGKTFHIIAKTCLYKYTENFTTKKKKKKKKKKRKKKKTIFG